MILSAAGQYLSSTPLPFVKTDPPPRRITRTDSSQESRHGWEIALAGDLTEKQTELIETLMEVAPRSRGTIYFDSCGGSAYVGLSLAALIRLRGLEATGVVLGECSSAALVPFAACRRRFVTPTSYLYFHPVRWSSEENVRLEEAAEWTRHFGDLETQMDQLLSKLFDMPLDKLIEWTRPGRFFSGTEMAAAGLARLVDPFASDAWNVIRGRNGAP
ncbi:MAG: ATP-dependent Clp protease proteolytic subunit [Planctomycetales bacterium]